jgi:hypothetical protein
MGEVALSTRSGGPANLLRARFNAVAESPLWAGAILPFALIRALLAVIGVVANYYLVPFVNAAQPTAGSATPGNLPSALWWSWARFDSGYYLSIAAHGYQAADSIAPNVQSNWAFFPLYPLLIHIGAYPLGGTDDAQYSVGLIIATFCAFLAAVYLFKLTALEFGEQTASRAVLYMGLYPMSFYLWAVYPESLFLLLLLSSSYYARRRRWLLAGALGAIAVLTRPQGVLLFAILGWEFWQTTADRWAPVTGRAPGATGLAEEWVRSRIVGPLRSFHDRRTWAGLFCLALIPAAFASFLVYSQLTVGRFLAFAEAERFGWGRSLSNPLNALGKTLLRPEGPNPLDWNFYGLNVLALVAFSILFLVVVKCLPSVYRVAALLLLAFPLASGELNSLARYYLAAFPAFMALAWWVGRADAQGKVARHALVAASLAVLLCLGMVMFALQIPAIA